MVQGWGGGRAPRGARAVAVRVGVGDVLPLRMRDARTLSALAGSLRWRAARIWSCLGGTCGSAPVRRAREGGEQR